MLDNRSFWRTAVLLCTKHSSEVEKTDLVHDCKIIFSEEDLSKTFQLNFVDF